MNIHKTSPREYASVNAEAVADYLEDYSIRVCTIIQDYRDKLPTCNKSQLNAATAELETVYKRLRWILEGRY